MRHIKLNNEKQKRSGYACQTEIARELGVHVGTVAIWRKKTGFPEPKIISFGGTIALWDLSEVRAWRLSYVTKGRDVDQLISELESRIKALKKLK